MDKNVEIALQAQFNRERYNSALYEFCSLSFDNMGWNGFSKWMHEQSLEELTHSRKLGEFMTAKMVLPTFDPLEAIVYKEADNQVYAYFKEAYELELKTTFHLTQLTGLAQDMGEYELVALMNNFFLPEQTSSTKTLLDILGKLGQTSPNGWLILDEQLGE